MSGNLDAGEPGKRKRGRPRKNPGEATVSESVPVPARKRRKPSKPDADQPAVDDMSQDADETGAASEFAAAVAEGIDTPMFDGRRRYQFIMDEPVRHLLGSQATRNMVTASYVVNELVKKYCRGEIDIVIDREVAGAWLDNIKDTEMPCDQTTSPA